MVKLVTLVTHLFPDLDAAVSVWLLRRYLRVRNREGSVEVLFVPAGATLDGMVVDSDRDVIHLDTGNGQFDHHLHFDPEVCAAILVAQALDVAGDPRLKRILKMALDDDNAVEGHFGDLRSLLRGRSKDYGSEQALRMTLRDLDLLFVQECSRVQAEEAVARVAVWYETPVGKVCTVELPQDLLGSVGVTVGKEKDVAVFISRGTDTGYVGVFRLRGNKGDKGINLVPAFAAIRRAEARNRGLVIADGLLRAAGRTEGMGWFLHDSRNMLLCGTPKSPLPEELKTRLSLKEIATIVVDDLFRRYQSRTQS